MGFSFHRTKKGELGLPPQLAPVLIVFGDVGFVDAPNHDVVQGARDIEAGFDGAWSQYRRANRCQKRYQRGCPLRSTDFGCFVMRLLETPELGLGYLVPLF
jgi:hypothetical protein